MHIVGRGQIRETLTKLLERGLPSANSSAESVALTLLATARNLRLFAIGGLFRLQAIDRSVGVKTLMTSRVTREQHTNLLAPLSTCCCCCCGLIGATGSGFDSSDSSEKDGFRRSFFFV